MTSGLRWNEDLAYDDPQNSLRLMNEAADPYRYALEQELVHQPGTWWEYSSGNTMLLGAALRHASGKELPDFAQEALLEPLGITHARVDRRRAGARAHRLGRPAAAAARHGEVRAAGPERRQLERSPDRLRGLDQGIDRAAHEGLAAVRYGYYVGHRKHRPSPGRSVALDRRLRLRRPAALHRPVPRPRRRDHRRPLGHHHSVPSRPEPFRAARARRGSIGAAPSGSSPRSSASSATSPPRA